MPMTSTGEDPRDSRRDQLEEVAENAIDSCVEEGVLSDYLRERRDFVKESIMSQLELEDELAGFTRMGSRDAALANAMGLMKTMGWDADEALRTLDVPQSERSDIAADIERGNVHDLRDELDRLSRESVAGMEPEIALLNFTVEDAHALHYEEAWDETTLSQVDSLAKTQGWDHARAMSALGISEEEQERYLSQLEQEE